jgi:site-specific recombinase XerD
MIVVLWRAGLRIQEAVALAEHDLDQRCGSILVRSGKAAVDARSEWTSGAGSSCDRG